MSENQVYWWLMLDNVSGTLQVMGVLIGIFSFIGLIMFTVFALIEENFKLLFGSLVCFILIPLACLACLIPNSKQYAMVKVFPKISNSELAKEVVEDVPEMYQMARDYMKEMLKIKESE